MLIVVAIGGVLSAWVAFTTGVMWILNDYPYSRERVIVDRAFLISSVVLGLIIGSTFLFEYAEKNALVIRMDHQGQEIARSDSVLWCFTAPCVNLPETPILVFHEQTLGSVEVSITYAVEVLDWNLVTTQHAEKFSSFWATNSETVERMVSERVRQTLRTLEDKEPSKLDLQHGLELIPTFLNHSKHLEAVNHDLAGTGLRAQAVISLRLHKKLEK